MKVGIIGGGLTGLVAAYDLTKNGHSVSVFEAGPELGGQVGTMTVGGGRVERYYHHIFTNDADIISLMDELELTKDMQWLESTVAFCVGNKIHPFVTALDLLSFSPIGFIDRVRLGLVGIYLQRYTDWRKLEHVTAKEWIIKYAGRSNYENVWGPLLKGKFGDTADEVGMVWYWGKVHQRFASRGKGMQKEKLGYLSGSFGRIADGLAQRIQSVGGVIRTGRPVSRVVVENGRVTGLQSGADSQADPFDAVIATVSSPILLKLVPELTGDYAARLRLARYQAALCMTLVLKQQLSPIYWLNVSDPTIPFPLAVEQTNLIDASNYGGKRIVYLSNYLSKDSPTYQMSKDHLLAFYLPHLKKINPNFNPDWLEDALLYREEAGQPIVTTHYSSKVPPHATPIAGLYLANTTQSYPEDRSMNISVRHGRLMAAMVAEAGRGVTG
ncbi:MAG: NAD(P)/FAD-dependent oxidoreductase [Chloroflexi bacterium]|nr:NAD(P)/FAD-dependent oxidoreductase [Chloroflexota bacterium]